MALNSAIAFGAMPPIKEDEEEKRLSNVSTTAIPDEYTNKDSRRPLRSGKKPTIKTEEKDNKDDNKDENVCCCIIL